MSQMNLLNKNLTNLGLNPGHPIIMVLVWVAYCVAYDFLWVSRFLLMSNVIVMEGHLYSHKKILVKSVL